MVDVVEFAGVASDVLFYSGLEGGEVLFWYHWVRGVGVGGSVLGSSWGSVGFWSAGLVKALGK